MLEALSSSRLNFLHASYDDNDYDTIIVIADNTMQIEKLPYGNIIIKRMREKQIIDNNNHRGFVTVLPNEKGTTVVIKKNVNSKDLYKWFSDVSKCFKTADITADKRIALILNHASDQSADAMVRTVLAHTQNMPNYKRKPDKCIAEIDIIGDYAESDFLEVLAKHKGNALARYLTTLPTNYLTPLKYIQSIEKMAKTEGWRYQLYDKKMLEEMGAGAFSAVARASDVAGVIKLTYQPQEGFDKTVSFVGKGVCFDTGGVSLKQPQYMEGMNDDMMGSAVALGTFLALSMQQVPYQMHCYLAVVQNNVDKNAFLPNEVVTALNGKTIEVIDTDAEGRMILADTLVLASQDKPHLIIDYATLTGAAVRAIGTQYSAVFSNHYDWQDQLVQCGIASAEKVWPFPMDNLFLQDLESDLADLKQCQVTGNADHILAAKFLQQFVAKDIRWLHMDLASCKNKGGLGAIPTEITGVGVWYSCQLLDQYFSLDEHTDTV